jgi:hypothetical protein
VRRACAREEGEKKKHGRDSKKKGGKKKQTTHVLVQAQLRKPRLQGGVLHVEAHGRGGLAEAPPAGLVGDVRPQGGELGRHGFERFFSWEE